MGENSRIKLNLKNNELIYPINHVSQKNKKLRIRNHCWGNSKMI